IRQLQTTPVPTEELHLLRNYLMGNFLAHINDPFSIMDRFKDVHWHGLDQAHYTRLYETIHQLNADQIMTLAQQYLTTDSLSTVVVG
ncbi:MAG: insulinase family protein, partial [Bacteroidota bacterium]